MKDLEQVLKSLKSNKSRDPDGFDRTIFGTKIGGKNLKLSKLNLFNKMKTESDVTMFMRLRLVQLLKKDQNCF